jgi:DNA-binding PadR family transcriptional regulator
VTVRCGLLGLLAHRAGDVFGLKADFEALFDGLWPIVAAEISAELTELEQEGLVQHQGLPGESLPERPIYEPTAAGRRMLARWLETPSERELPITDELALKLALNQVLGATHGLSLIWAERQACMEELERLYAVRDSGRLESLAVLLVERSIMAQEARVRWLGFCEDRLVAQP